MLSFLLLEARILLSIHMVSYESCRTCTPRSPSLDVLLHVAQGCGRRVQLLTGDNLPSSPRHRELLCVVCLIPRQCHFMSSLFAIRIINLSLTFSSSLCLQMGREVGDSASGRCRTRNVCLRPTQPINYSAKSSRDVFSFGPPQC